MADVTKEYVDTQLAGLALFIAVNQRDISAHETRLANIEAFNCQQEMKDLGDRIMFLVDQRVAGLATYIGTVYDTLLDLIGEVERAETNTEDASKEGWWDIALGVITMQHPLEGLIKGAQEEMLKLIGKGLEPAAEFAFAQMVVLAEIPATLMFNLLIDFFFEGEE